MGWHLELCVFLLLGLCRNSNMMQSADTDEPAPGSVSFSDLALLALQAKASDRSSGDGNMSDEEFAVSSEEAAFRVKAAKLCEIQHSKLPPLTVDDVANHRYCNRTFDGWGCWNDTLAGTTAEIPCPSIIGLNPEFTAYKKCTENGTWWVAPSTGAPWSNYTKCIDFTDMEKAKATLTVFYTGYAISIVFLSVALFIFFFFKQLSCDRITLHKNLFASYIATGLVWILYYSVAASDPNILASNPVWCRVLHFFCTYFTVSNFFWMFSEGLYLHTMIVVAFMSGKRLLICCYLIGWVLPLVPSLVYVALRAASPEKEVYGRCWTSMTSLHWINAGMIIASFILNFLFVCNIIRVLLTKLRAVHSPDANSTRKAVRATMILIPLLGLQYIIIPFRPEDPTTAKIYDLLSATVTSFQGFLVALIFCFFNSEVITLLKRKYSQRMIMKRHDSFGVASFVSPNANTQLTVSLTTKENGGAVDGHDKNGGGSGDNKNGEKKTLMNGKDTSVV